MATEKHTDPPPCEDEEDSEVIRERRDEPTVPWDEIEPRVRGLD